MTAVTRTPLEPLAVGGSSPARGEARGLGVEYLTTIGDAIRNEPRSLQTRVGPSELGHACRRRLAYKMLGQKQNLTVPNWKATVGTALHAWLENVFDQANLAWAPDHEGVERFYIETRVSVGEVNGEDINGSCDLYDSLYFTVTDWKTTGPTQLQKYRSKGPGPQYRAQAHLYGRGLTRAGYRVDRVQIVFLPRNGELADTYIWSEPYDETVALDALERATGIALATSILGAAALPALATADAFCQLCPYFNSRSTDLAAGCPGDAGSRVNNYPPTTGDPFGSHIAD